MRTPMTMQYKQLIKADREKVFKMLCPVRERDWLEGWKYSMISSESGLMEREAVFTTPAIEGEENDTVWYISEHDPETYKLEMLRFSAGEAVTKINIKLIGNLNGTTESYITYKYIPLTEEYEAYLEESFPETFREQMEWWEKSMNHYIETDGERLEKANIPVETKE